MPLVTVNFLGICTHFLKTMHEELPARHRVVLVNASHAVDILGHLITPHVATVWFDDAESINAEGCRFELFSEPEVPFVHSAEFLQVPNLTAMMVSRRFRNMPPIDKARVLYGDAEKAALYFDFNSGKVTAGVTEGAVHVTLTVNAPEVTLRVTPFRDRHLPSELRPEYRLTSDTTIFVMNEDVPNPPTPPPARAYAESRYDFLLHYLTGEWIPDDPPIPQAEDAAKLPRVPIRSYGAVGAGCSNSNYP